MESNQKVVESLLKIALLCGKQGLAFRGHRDDKNLSVWSDIGDEHPNEGNFVELVWFRAETDPILAQHLVNSPQNARYTSKTIQNELVGVIGNSIRNDIVKEVKRAKFYSVIADEVTDSANKEELSLALWYILDVTIKEVFVDLLK